MEASAGGGTAMYPPHRCKTIHLVRHAQGAHNVEGERDHSVYMKPEFFDAQVTPLGWSQVDCLREHVKRCGLAEKVELVISSPLRPTPAAPAPYLFDTEPRWWVPPSFLRVCSSSARIRARIGRLPPRRLPGAPPQGRTRRNRAPRPRSASPAPSSPGSAPARRWLTSASSPLLRVCRASKPMSWEILQRQRRRFRMYDDEEFLHMLNIIATMEEEEEAPHRGSVFGRRVIHRDRSSGYFRLMMDYFSESPVYGDEAFRRRFRMTKDMFKDICGAVSANNRYFQLTCNAAHTPGFHTIQKVTAALRMLAYGGPADSIDEYLRMGESTILETLGQFTRTICHLFAAEYLRKPNAIDVAGLLEVAQARGFPGMLGSIDCMHWEWEKCPTAWHGSYRGHFKKPTVILEAIASHDLWIWHAFFGLPGSCNDINVLHRSPVFENLARGNAPECNYMVNGRQYTMGYYLADGIYPPWATLIGGVSVPVDLRQELFTAKQSEFRKDVERTFGVLQGQYAITKGPARLWDPVDLKYIIDCVIILHNMGIKYERHLPQLLAHDYEAGTSTHFSEIRDVPEIRDLIKAHEKIRCKSTNEQLKQDLIEHVWNHEGQRRGGN